MKAIRSLLFVVCMAIATNAHALINTFPYVNEITTAEDVADWTLSGCYFSTSYNGCLAFYKNTDYCILPELDGDYMSIKTKVGDAYDFQVYATTEDGKTDNLIGNLSSVALNIPYGTKFIKIRTMRNSYYVYLRDITITNSKLDPNTQWMVGDDIVATWEWNTLVLSGSGAMYNKNSADQYPYHGKNFEKLIVEEGITSIGNYAFSDRAGLKTIQLPQSLVSIGDNAFYNNTNLKDISLPESLKSIRNYAFYGCSGPTSLYIPDATETIGDYAFYKMDNLDYVLIGTGLKSLGNYAFYDCDKLKTLRYTATDCQTFGSEYYPVFKQCGWLQTIIFGENVETIPPYMFCGLESQFNLYHQQGQKVSGYEDRGDIAIPPTIKKIGKGAFIGVSMDILSIPSSVETIGAEAFRGCGGLDKIYCDNVTPPTLEGNLVFHDINKGVCLLIVPSEAYENYSRTNQWRDFVFIVEPSYFTASIKRMSINSQELDGFKSDKYVYSYTVPYEVDRVSVYAEAESIGSTITGTGAFDLNIGLNVFVISITAPDGVTSNSYSIAITRQDTGSGIDDLQAGSRLNFNSLVTDGYLKLFDFDENRPVEIFDCSGNKLMSVTGNDKLLNVSSCPNGLYIIRNGKEVGKFIIQKK